MKTFTVLVLLTFLVSMPAAAQQKIYGIAPVGGVDTQLWDIRVNPGFATTLIDSFGLVKGGSGLDFNPTNGKLYASTGFAGGAGGNLFTVDTTTGAATKVGSSGFPAVPGLAFAPNGRLYGTAATYTTTPANVLIRIRPDSGTGTFVGAFGKLGADSIKGLDGIAFHPTTGVLYAGSGKGTDNKFGRFFVIDTATGMATSLGFLRRVGTGDTLPNTLAGLTFDAAGNCFGSLGNDDGRIIRIYLDSLKFEFLGDVGDVSVSDIAIARGITVSVAQDLPPAPKEFALLTNYPNPFNPSTTISFSVGRHGRASLQVYNLLGQQAARLFDGEAEAGRLYSKTFDAKNLPSGIYFAVLESNGRRLARKVLLAK